MKFEYSTVAGVSDSRGKMVKRPVLSLEIKTKDGDTVEALGVIDSGADTTTLNIQYAEAMGIKLSRKREIMGIGNGRVAVHEGAFPF